MHARYVQIINNNFYLYIIMIVVYIIKFFEYKVYIRVKTSFSREFKTEQIIGCYAINAIPN